MLIADTADWINSLIHYFLRPTKLSVSAVGVDFKALQKAKDKAESMATELGTELGGVLMIQEGRASVIQPRMYAEMAADSNAQESEVTGELNIKPQKISASVTVQFKLE